MGPCLRGDNDREGTSGEPIINDTNDKNADTGSGPRGNRNEARKINCGSTFAIVAGEPSCTVFRQQNVKRRSDRPLGPECQCTHFALHVAHHWLARCVSSRVGVAPPHTMLHSLLSLPQNHEFKSLLWLQVSLADRSTILVQLTA